MRPWGTRGKAAPPARSNLTKYRGNINSYRIELQDRLGIGRLNLDRVERADLYTSGYYGHEYLRRGVAQVTDEARQNDAEIRVLELARSNSVLKKRLSEQGKWDVFGRLTGEYDSHANQENKGARGYFGGAGVDVRLIDPAYLSVSMKRAEAEISKYEAKIDYRDRELTNGVDRKVAKAGNLRRQADELVVSATSRREVFRQKLKAYLDGRETMDNLVSARRSLLESELNLSDVLGDLFEIITELDQETGVYFTELGLSVENPAR